MRDSKRDLAGHAPTLTANVVRAGSAPARGKRARGLHIDPEVLANCVDERVDLCYGVGAQQIKLVISGVLQGVSERSATVLLDDGRQAILPLGFIVRFGQ